LPAPQPPQSRVLLQPSDAAPQATPCWAQVLAKQGLSPQTLPVPQILSAGQERRF